MNTKIIFALSLSVSILALAGFVLTQQIPSSSIGGRSETKIEQNIKNDSCTKNSLSGSHISSYQCGGEIAMWSLSLGEMPTKNGSGWHTSDEANGVISLTAGTTFSQNTFRIDSSEDTIFIVTTTPEGLAKITALTSPITLSLLDKSAKLLTSVVIIPGMSLVHNPQTSDLEGADFFRIVQLLTIEMADITKGDWITKIARGYDVQTLLGDTKKAQESTLELTLSKIDIIAQDLSKIAIDEPGDILEESLTLNPRKNELRTKKQIGHDISAHISSYKKRNGQDIDILLSGLTNSVDSLTPLAPRVSESLTQHIQFIQSIIKTRITIQKSATTFSDHIGIAAQKTLFSNQDLSEREISLLFAKLKASPRATTFNQAMTEVFASEQMSRSSLSSAYYLSAGESLDLWITLSDQVIRLIKSEDERKSTLSYLLNKGNDLILQYKSLLNNSFFVPGIEEYIVLDRQKNNNNPLSNSQSQGITNLINTSKNLLTREKTHFYTISEEYRNDTLDPYKLLIEHISQLEYSFDIIMHLQEYAAKKYTPKALGTAEGASSISSVEELFSRLSLPLSSLELLDANSTRYRALAVAYRENISLDIATGSGMIKAANITDTKRDISIAYSIGGASLGEFYDFMKNDLDKILTKVVQKQQKQIIPLDISKRSFIVDGTIFAY